MSLQTCTNHSRHCSWLTCKQKQKPCGNYPVILNHCSSIFHQLVSTKIFVSISVTFGYTYIIVRETKMSNKWVKRKHKVCKLLRQHKPPKLLNVSWHWLYTSLELYWREHFISEPKPCHQKIEHKRATVFSLNLTSIQAFLKTTNVICLLIDRFLVPQKFV